MSVFDELLASAKANLASTNSMLTEQQKEADDFKKEAKATAVITVNSENKGKTGLIIGAVALLAVGGFIFLKVRG